MAFDFLLIFCEIKIQYWLLYHLSLRFFNPIFVQFFPFFTHPARARKQPYRMNHIAIFKRNHLISKPQEFYKKRQDRQSPVFLTEQLTHIWWAISIPLKNLPCFTNKIVDREPFQRKVRRLATMKKLQKTLIVLQIIYYIILILKELG